MGNNYYLRSLKVNGFRGFNSLDLSGLRRINILGGFNGVGKTRLLETIFFTLDVRNSLAVAKPFMWRKPASTSIGDLSLLVSDDGATIKISVHQQREEIQLRVNRSKMPDEAVGAISSAISQAVAQGAPLNSDRRNLQSEYGITLKVIYPRNFSKPDWSFVVSRDEGVFGTMMSQSDYPIPRCQYLGQTITMGSVEFAARVSQIIREKRISKLVEYAKLVEPNVTNFVVLQEGSGAAVYAEIRDNYLPIELMGDGFRNLIYTVSTIMTLKNGVVLLDEIDASFHYSLVSRAWKVFSEVSRQENCQIFACTHSKEAIVSAAKGVADAGNENDFTYFRIEQVSGYHQAIPYRIQDIMDADKFEAEIR